MEISSWQYNSAKLKHIQENFKQVQQGENELDILKHTHQVKRKLKKETNTNKSENYEVTSISQKS